MHPVDKLANLLEVDMTKYWTPTRGSYLSHVSKARIAEVVSMAVSPEAAVPLAVMKKEEAAAAAELRLVGTGWIPEVLAYRDVADLSGDDDQSAEETDEKEEDGFSI